MGKKEIILIFIAALLFSTMEVALKIAGGGLDPFQLTFIRFAIGGLFLLPFAIKERNKKTLRLNKGDFVYLSTLGIICICISMLFFQLAIMKANANLIAIIICSNPIFTMIFAHFITSDKFTKRKAFVLLISMIGILIVANPFHITTENSAIGILFGLIAAITFGLYSAMGKLRIEKIGEVAQTSFSFLFGSIAMLVIMVFMKKPLIAGVGFDNLLLILYLGIFVTGVGYYCYFQAIHSCGPANASIAFFLKPVFAPIIALVILKEALTVNMIIGIVLILIGSYINIRTPKQSKIT